MKYYLADIIPRIRKYSATLDQSTFLVDKPWVVSSDNSKPYEKLIFRRDGRVHLSSDGNVTDGNWEYLPEAQSLLIDYGKKKVLYRHQFLDEAVLALKPDGFTTEEDYFLLANENVIPNLNVKKYLRDKYLQDRNIEILRLDNGNEVELYKDTPDGSTIISSETKIDGETVKDGEYLYQEGQKKIFIKGGRVKDIKKKIPYYPNISAWSAQSLPSVGDKVEGLKNGSFKIKSSGTFTIFVKNSRVSKVRDHIIYTVLKISIAIVIIFVIAIILG